MAGVAGAACVVALRWRSCCSPPRPAARSGGYTVRAIFDDAGNIIPGENVKIDGVKVGTVGVGRRPRPRRRPRSC